jgi:hypothetical protein
MPNNFLKQEVERAIGDDFVKWLNRTTGSKFQFERMGADPPDLIYRDGDKTVPVEVATSYYNEEDAIMRWKHARKDPTAPATWSDARPQAAKPPWEHRSEPDQKLIAGINKRIAEKCRGKHDVGTVLVIQCFPSITTKVEFEERKDRIAIPSSNPFTAIYVAGSFPGHRDSLGGYFCWKVA